MTTTADGTARAAAQLREAARDVALVAERRAAQYEVSGDRADEATPDTVLLVGEPPTGRPEAPAAEAVAGTVITAVVRARLASAADEDFCTGKSA